MDGELVRDGDAYVLRFQRDLPHPVDRVWQAITDPSHLAAWFPHPVELELRVGGKAVFINDPSFDVDEELLASSGEVIELDPNRRFAFTWGNDLLRFELSPTATGCRLVFTHHLPHRACVNRTVSGWSVCLDSFEASLDGVAANSPGWRHYYDRYVEVLGDDGVVSHEDGRTVLRFERLMPASKERVQSALRDEPFDSPEGQVKWQLIPIGDTSLALLTHTVDGDWDATAATAEWDRVLRGLAERLA
ncbi:MAG TPA: SRPBCC family protein [Mycobacteriales bacterium]|nr:SRPBCC family protein [Mycobacteriales bacterium]